MALAVASVVYGGLLGAFLLGVTSQRATAESVRVGVVVGIGSVTLIWIFLRTEVAWPWFSLVGSAITFALGSLLGRGSPSYARDQPAGPG